MGLGEGKYAVYGTRVLREFSSPQDAIRAENENIIKGYARRYNKPLSFVRQKLLADPDFLVKTSKSDKRFALPEDTDSREGGQSEKRSAERSATREELDAWAKENVKEYEELLPKERSEIRALIRQARAYNYSDAEITTLARVSARSHVRIIFSKERALLGKDAEGRLNCRIGTIFFRTPGLVTKKGVHAMQRLMWIDDINAGREAEGLPPLTEAEEQLVKEIDDDLLWYDLRDLLHNSQEGEEPQLHIVVSHAVQPFVKVEEQYLAMFEEWKAKIAP